MGGLLWALGCNLAQPKWATLGAHTPPQLSQALGGHMQQPNPPNKPLASMVCHLSGTPCNAPTKSGPNMQGCKFHGSKYFQRTYSKRSLEVFICWGRGFGGGASHLQHVRIWAKMAQRFKSCAQNSATSTHAPAVFNCLGSKPLGAVRVP